MPIIADKDSTLFGNLGTVYLTHGGFDLGRTRGGATLAIEVTEQELTFDQTENDSITTKIEYTLTTSFADINTRILNLLIPGFNKKEGASPDDEATAIEGDNPSSILIKSGDLYVSKKTLGKPLILTAVAPTGDVSTNLNDKLNFYHASIQIASGDLLSFSSETAKELPITFIIYGVFVDVTIADVTSKQRLFGYSGNPTDFGVVNINDYSFNKK